ncbi:MAG: TMEM175 family protein [Methanobacteriaceae archaeon]|nr:TMEM175 family protein [Methanobacteriaceae archaeon]
MFKHYAKIIDLEPDRLMALTDGIFAIAITLLILNLEIPETAQFTSYLALNHFLINLIPQIITYAASFIILSTFWIYHHVYLRVKYIDILFLWFNIIWLIFIVLMPFTTSLISVSSQFFAADLIFGGTVLISVLLFLGIFHYAWDNNMLEESIKKSKKAVYRSLSMMIIITILASILGYIFNGWGVLLYLLLPIYSIIKISNAKN